LFAIEPLIGTKEGALYTSQITFKCNAILLAMIPLLSTTPIFTLGYAMANGEIFFDEALVPHSHVHTHKFGRLPHEHKS
jgi:hypothetical protein